MTEIVQIWSQMRCSATCIYTVVITPCPMRRPIWAHDKGHTYETQQRGKCWTKPNIEAETTRPTGSNNFCCFLSTWPLNIRLTCPGSRKFSGLVFPWGESLSTISNKIATLQPAPSRFFLTSKRIIGVNETNPKKRIQCLDTQTWLSQGQRRTKQSVSVFDETETCRRRYHRPQGGSRIIHSDLICVKWGSAAALSRVNTYEY